MAILEVCKISKVFGGLVALDEVDLQVEAGEILGVIGPNGAGKSTLYNVLTGVYPSTRGRVIFQGKDITGMKPHQIIKRGLARTFQANRLFMHLPVLENVWIGCHVFAKTNILGGVFGISSDRQRESKAWERARHIVKLVGLEAVSGELASNLPHGYQRALGVALALGAEPKLLCLDEPLTGMSADERTFMLSVIENTRRQGGTTILLVEHDVKSVMGICDRIVVLNFGRKIAEGKPAEIKNNKDVIEAYLGVEEHDT